MKPSDFALSGHDTFIDLWPMVEVVKAYANDNSFHLYHPQGFTEVLNRIENQIERLRWCEEVSFNHQAWARFDFDTTRPEVLARRISQTQAKLVRIAARYPPRNPI